jgi:hypothetical protein
MANTSLCYGISDIQKILIDQKKILRQQAEILSKIDELKIDLGLKYTVLSAAILLKIEKRKRQGIGWGLKPKDEWCQQMCKDAKEKE